jgi:SET domain-containing protein
MKGEVRKSGIAGDGLFARYASQEGEAVGRLEGMRVSDAEADAWCESGRIRYDDPFQLSVSEYLILDPASLAINHSCEPNLGIRGERELVALRAINPGEELCYDYSTVVGKDELGEDPWAMACACGAGICRRTIGNWQTIPPERVAYYLAHDAVPAFVRQQMREAGIVGA